MVVLYCSSVKGAPGARSAAWREPRGERSTPGCAPPRTPEASLRSSPWRAPLPRTPAPSPPPPAAPGPRGVPASPWPERTGRGPGPSGRLAGKSPALSACARGSSAERAVSARRRSHPVPVRDLPVHHGQVHLGGADLGGRDPVQVPVQDHSRTVAACVSGKPAQRAQIVWPGPVPGEANLRPKARRPWRGGPGGPGLGRPAGPDQPGARLAL